jgi:bacterioferritin
VAQRNEIKQSRNLREVLEMALAFESKAVELYSQAIELAGTNRPLVLFLEDILLEEQEGVDEYTKLLRQSESVSAVDSARKSG